jgi:hypothetical protein
MVRRFEASAKKQNWTMDARALAWTLDSLDEDHELEQFAAGIPGLFVSKAVGQPADLLASISESSTPSGPRERYPETCDRLVATCRQSPFTIES